MIKMEDKEKQFFVLPEKEKTVSLKEFIEDHQKVISVIGVFMALGLFWHNMTDKETGSYVSFLCFLITVPLMVEVWRDVRRVSSWNLIIFTNILTFIVFNTAYFIFMGFPNYRNWLIKFILGILLFLLFILGLDKLLAYVKNLEVKRINKLLAETSSKISQEKLSELKTETSNYLARQMTRLELVNLLVFFLCILVSGYIANSVSPYINSFIEIQTIGQPNELVPPINSDIVFPVNNP